MNVLPKKILLVEDSEDFQSLVFEELSEYRITAVNSSEEALQAIRTNDYDLVLLDLTLASGSGFAVLEALKNYEMATSPAVICISGSAKLEDRLKVFELGADDYVQKPFYFAELIARIESKLTKLINTTSLGDLEINLKTNTVLRKSTLGNEEIHLTKTEFKILSFFIKNPNQIISKEDIRSEVWGRNCGTDPKAIPVHVCSLRKKLMSKEVDIVGVPGFGYKALILDRHCN